jgi:hypothetical protein
VYTAVYRMASTRRKSLKAFARLLDSQSSNPGSIPGSATKPYCFCNQLLNALFRKPKFSVRSVLCSPQDLFRLSIAFRPDLFQTGMLVKPCHVHFCCAHRIHHGYDVACAVHRVGTEPVSSAIEPTVSGRPTNFLARSNCFCVMYSSFARHLQPESFCYEIHGLRSNSPVHEMAIFPIL